MAARSFLIPVFAIVACCSDVQDGIRLFRQRKFAEARHALERALKAEPKDFEARTFLIRSHIEMGELPRALQELQTLLSLAPGNPEVQFQAAQILQQLAGDRFAGLQRLAPDSAETHELLGRHYEATGRLREALREYRLALERNPQGAGLRFLIGNVLWKLMEFDAALPELRAELRSNPGHTMASYRVGHILVSQRKAEEAVPHLEAVVRTDPKFLDARRELGRALRLIGRHQEALKELRLVAEGRPDDELVHAQLAAVYKALGDNERATAAMAAHEEVLRKRRELAGRK